VQNAKFANITGNYFGLSTESAIYLVDVDGGTITGNTINSPGYNTPNSSAATAPAGIRLIGCQQVAVSGNTISTASGATYNGFGIISTNNGARIARCVFTGNKISSVFNGATHRSQSRHLNVETTDSLSGNLFDGTTVEHRMLRTPAGAHYAVALTYQASAGSVLIPLNDTASARVYFHVEQVSTNTSLEFEVIISRTNFAGTYSIKGVNRDVTANVGLGPHTVTAGNTVAFAISGSSLQVTFAYTTDPMLYSAVVVGARS
jgi:parallel beta-helix repeat protein